VSAAGSLFGQFQNHAAALSSTVHEPYVMPDLSHAMRQVAAYPRREDPRTPYRVVHDLTVHRPYGRFVVYVGDRRAGAQLSFPSADDCRRMDRLPPAPALPSSADVKRCAGCKVDHPLEAFTQGTGPGGLHRYCRDYLKAWRQQRVRTTNSALFRKAPRG
jgi:hypothetical protein